MIPWIGSLRARIVIQQEARTPDGAGGYALAWSDVVSLWARIEPVSGRETLQGARLESRVTHRITIRYRSGVDAGMRALYGSRIFNIRAVINPGEDNRHLRLLAEEGGAS